MTIGDIAARAGVSTSSIRYYERRGLLTPDARVSGQRRYRAASLRRLVFIGMLQDAGLSLDEIGEILAAESNAEWTSIARTRLAHLDDEIATLTRARELLEASLLCRFDHPLDECKVMGTEIDRRLES